MPRPIKIGKVWYSDIRINGHRIRRRLSKNYQEAELKLAKMVQLRDSEKWGDPVDDLSLELFEAKYMVYSQGAKKVNTTMHDRLAIKYLRQALPITKLNQITPEILEQVKYKWKQEGKNSNYINRHLTAIKAMMRKAEEWKYIKPQDWRKVKKIKTTESRELHWTISELSKILKFLNGDYKTVGYLAGRAGLRLGEIVHLYPSDIDFKLKRINITAKPDWNPKDYEKRFIPMPEDLLDYLKSCTARQVSILGRQWKEQSLSHMMARTIKGMGYVGTTHTFRHTWATHLVMNGVDIESVSKLLGHASSETTRKHYIHLVPSHLDKAADKLPPLE